MSIKPFLDANPSFIPTPWLLDHQLHFGIILPQFSLSPGLKTDYVYLTKSSTSWWCVLVEFESPASRFFTSCTSIGVHSDLTRGLNAMATGAFGFSVVGRQDSNLRMAESKSA
jgi:hypothetical protein